MSEIDILKLKSRGYCCSQIMVQLALDMNERENPGLIRFAGGLCMGSGFGEGPCGILTAGMGLLALYTAQEKETLPLLQERFLSSFRQAAGAGINCAEITGEAYPSINPVVCGKLLSQSWEALAAILVENGFDPAEMPDV